MRFGLSEEQKMLDDTVRRYLDEACPLDTVREAAKDDAACDMALWAGLAELGVLGVMVPEASGGSGLGFLEAALVAEKLGAVVSPVPYLSTAILAPAALRSAGTEAQQQNWLPKIAAGEVRFGAGLMDATGSREGSGLALADGKVNGKTLFVMDAMSADVYLLAVGKETLVMVDKDAPGVTLTGLETIDRTRSVGELLLDGAPAEILDGGDGATAIAELVRLGRVALAADALGAANTMIDKAVAYSKEREQFNRPIGSFQAVKHMCAEMAAALEPCRSLVWYAAHAQDALPEEAALTACHAKAHLAEVGREVARTATEVHGGMGFTDLLGLHYWFKRIGFDRQMLGSPEAVRQEAAVLQGWAA